MRETDRLLAFYRDRVESYPDVDAQFRTQWSALCRRVLEHGGRLVVPPMEPEPHLDVLLDGQIIDLRATRRRGEPNGCHANSATLWLRGAADALGTGYALSDDGLWRQHSWALTGTGRGRKIVETTVARDRYYGVELTGPHALAFALANIPGQVAAAISAGPSASAGPLWEAVYTVTASHLPALDDEPAPSPLR